MLTNAGPGTTALTVDSTGGLKVGDNVELTNLTNAVLLPVTGFGTNGSYPTIQVAALPSSSPSFSAAAGCVYAFRSRHVRYAVNPSYFSASASGNPSMLTMDLYDGNGPQPLAEGIEDMQIALGFDNNRDGNIVEVGSAPNDDEWVFNVAGETMPATLANLKVVRITLVAKSTQLEPELVSQRPAAEDHPIGSNDGFFRRVIRTVVSVRNFNI